MFFIRLPQLAVLAKILCLLMVVMCGAVPSTVRSVSLYSTCNRGNVSVFGRKVNTTMVGENTAPYQKITTQSEGFDLKLYLFAEETKHYICFTKRWKIVGLPKNKRNKMCQFYESYHGRYLRYQSVVDPKRFIGFNKKGRPLHPNSTRSECYNFIKMNPFSVDLHNDIVASHSRAGSMKHRSLALSHHRPASRLHSAANRPSSRSSSKTNYLIPPPSSASTRTSTTTRVQQQQQHHRHRHWKTMPHSEDVTRRRHRRPGLGRRHGSLFVEDKY